MRAYEQKIVEELFEAVVRSENISGKQIYLFGAGDYSRYMIRLLASKGMMAEAIIDNDKRKQGAYCAGCKVISIDNIKDVCSQNNVYLLCSDFWKEMKKQLLNVGVSEQQIFVIRKKELSLKEKVKDAKKGFKVYKDLRKQYENHTIFLCPYTGTGDIYLIGTFWSQYIERQKISDYIFVVLSKACGRVAKLFPIKNVVTLDDMAKAKYLIDYYLLKNTNIDMVLLNDGWRELTYSHTEWLRGYKGLHFTQLFKKFVFDLDDSVRPIHPAILECSDDIKKLFEEKQLIPGRTVVLSPYSNTLFDVPESFWISLAEKLRKKGYTVCTNCNGDKESAITGTVGIFVYLDKAPEFVEYAGNFIGIRSGFCDIISGTTANKAILYYKENRFYNTSAFDYFNLKGMELCDDAFEIEFTMDDVDDLEERLIKWIK